MSTYEKKVKPRLNEIKAWCGSMSKEQIAKRLGVSKRSLYRYINEYEELKKVIEDATEELVVDLKKSLLMKAKGFHYKETKKTMRVVDDVKTQVVEEYEKYSPPDTGAIHLLLKNLDDEWRNDDKATLDLKREKLELEKEKTEKEYW